MLGLWLATLALALDLSSVKGEPKPEKRSELALTYANTALNTAKTAYQEGRWEETQAALKDLDSAVTLSYDSLTETGKNPRKTNAFKNAEKATRELLRRLTGFRDFMSAVDHPVVDPVVAKVTHVHEQLIQGIMAGK